MYMDTYRNQYFPSYYKKQYNKLVANKIHNLNILIKDLNSVVIEYLIGNIYHNALSDDVNLLRLSHKDTFKMREYEDTPSFYEYLRMYYSNNLMCENCKFLSSRLSKEIYLQDNRRNTIVRGIELQLDQKNPLVEKYRSQLEDIEKV